MPSPLSADILNVPESAIYTHRSEDFVRRRLKHEVPHIQHGKYGPMFFRRSDLDVWLARNTTVPAR